MPVKVTPVKAMSLKPWKGFCVAMLLMLTLGCQSLSGRSTGVPVADGHYQLQYSWPETPLQLWQKVEWQKGEEQRTFMVSAVFDHQRLLLIALSPFGHELFRTELSRKNGITFTGSEAFDNSRLAMQVWADLQMALWPLDSVNANLAGATLQATQTRRELWHNDRLLWVADNENTRQPWAIQNKQMGYQLLITTLEYELLETDDNHIK